MFFSPNLGLEVVNVQRYIRVVWLEILLKRILKSSDNKKAIVYE